MSELEAPTGDSSIRVEIIDSKDEKTLDRILARFKRDDGTIFRVVSEYGGTYKLHQKRENGNWWLAANIHGVKGHTLTSNDQQAVNIGYRNVSNDNYTHPPEDRDEDA